HGGRRLADKKSERLGGRVLHMHGHALAGAVAAEVENAVDERTATLAGRDDAIQVAAGGAVRRRDVQQPFAKTEYCPEDVVEVVRDAASKSSHRLEALCLAQSALQAQQVLLRALEI